MKTDKRKTERRRQSGVTLIEMMVVVTIIALFSALVAPKMFRRADAARSDRGAGADQRFLTALGAYKLDTSTFPTTEQGFGALRVAPAGCAVVEGPVSAAGSPAGSVGQALCLQVSGRAWG